MGASLRQDEYYLYAENGGRPQGLRVGLPSVGLRNDSLFFSE
jgi:hypothetical protein